MNQVYMYTHSLNSHTDWKLENLYKIYTKLYFKYDTRKGTVTWFSKERVGIVKFYFP